MGLFSTTARKTSAKDTTTTSAAKDAPAARPRLSLRSVLARRDNGSTANGSTDGKSAPLKRAKSLTVLVEPKVRAAPEGPCRFVATSTKLGSGAYGAVLLGHDLCSGNSPVAIKFIPDGRMRASSLEREVAMLQRLSDVDHPALVKFHGHLRPADVKAGEMRAEGTLPLTKPKEQCHALVMEAVKGGELFDYVVKVEGLKEPEAAPLFAQLCDAVHAAHGIGITHRDLKLENVLLVRKRNAPMSPRQAAHAAAAAAHGGPAYQSSIKLIDWGLAHQHAMAPDGSIVAELLHSRCGSRSYMAPEVTNREISGVVGYDGFAADVWSLGVCLFAMHLAFFPFEQAHPEHDWRARRVIEAQKAGKSTMATILSFYPQKAANGGLSPSLLALLDRMLVFDPRKRATLTEVLCSEWLAPHVPAACYRATIARTVSIAHLATRSSRSVSSCSSESGGSTPRLEMPPPYPNAAAYRPSVERIDSNGTVVTTSSCTSYASSYVSSHRDSTALAAGGADGGASTTQRAASAVAAAVRAHLPPPPPSPLSVVVAGGATGNQRGGGMGQAHPLPGGAKQGRVDGKEAPDALEIATMLSKACKVSNLGSPRHPDRNIIL